MKIFILFYICYTVFENVKPFTVKYEVVVNPNL